MIRGALLAAFVAAALRLPAPATAQQQSLPGAVCKASCAGPPPTSVIGFNTPITLYGYTHVGAPFDANVPGNVGCDSPLSQVLCQDIADFASDSLCAEGEVATSSCVPVVSEEVQGPLCGATCAGVALQGFSDGWNPFDEEFPFGIPDGTEGTITLALEQQGAEMTDEMCTAACAISSAACMDVRSRARALSL